MPTLSVIVPIYNTAQYLSECLESVCNQTLRDIEIICINDGSTDDSLEILNAFKEKDERIKIIDQENKGVSAARNAGVEQACGSYLLFLDADDLFVPEDFCKIIPDLSAHDFIACNFGIMRHEIIETSQNKIMYNEKTEKEQLIIDYVRWHLKIRIGSFLICRKMVLQNNIKFNVGQSYAEDVEFIIYSLFYCKNFVTAPQVMNFYRDNVNSAVHKVNYKRFETLYSRKRLRDFFLKKGKNFEELVSIYEGYLLPETAILTVELFARKGKNIFKLNRFLKEGDILKYMSNHHFNQHTPQFIIDKINKYNKCPFCFFMSNRFQEIVYNLKVRVNKFLMS